MKVFAIQDEFSTKQRPFCTISDDMPSVITFFDRHGQLLPGIQASANPHREGTYILLECTVSGGSYREFLRSALEKWNRQICLYLHKTCVQFTLPCFDGMGTASDLPAVRDAVYCEDLCANLCFSADGKTLILYDSADSLQQKYDIAREMEIPLMIAEEALLDKIKAP